MSTKHQPSQATSIVNNTDLPKHGQQQQQQHEESQAGEWIRQRAGRRKAQHGERVKPVNTQASKPAQIRNATQAPRAKPSLSNNMSQKQSRDTQRQAASNNADLPLKAASLNEAADRHTDSIKAAIGQPVSYSAAVGSASFWADVVTPLVGDKVPIAVLLKKYRGTDKHEQLIKLTKGSRPFTQYRSIRGESAHCIAMGHVVSGLSGFPCCLFAIACCQFASPILSSVCSQHYPQVLMVQTIYLQLSQICLSLRLLHVYVMLTVCLWLLCSCCFLQSVLLLPCTVADMLTNTFIPGANSDLFSSASVQG